MCGIVCAEDAELAAQSGAHFIGMIMWPKARRAVQPAMARSIAGAARRHGAKARMLPACADMLRHGGVPAMLGWQDNRGEADAPGIIYLPALRNCSVICVLLSTQAVGVFVDEDADTIARACEEAELDLAQLHGPGARDALLGLPRSLEVIYVMHADGSGCLQTPTPVEQAASLRQQLLRCCSALWLVHAVASNAALSAMNPSQIHG